MSHYYGTLFFVSLMTILAFGEGPKSSFTEAIEKSRTTILFSEKRLGNLEPNQCNGLPFGGIEREKNAFKVLQSKPGTILKLTAGPLFDGTLKEESAKVITAALKSLNFDAVFPAGSDLEFSAEVLKRLQTQSGGRWLHSSLMFSDSGQPVFESFIEFQTNSLPVFVLGVEEPQKSTAGTFKWLDPKQAIEAALKALPKKDRVVVVLSRLSFDAGKKLAAQIPEINFILGEEREKTGWIGPQQFFPGTVQVSGESKGHSIVSLTWSSPRQMPLAFYSDETRDSVVDQKNSLNSFKPKLQRDRDELKRMKQLLSQIPTSSLNGTPLAIEEIKIDGRFDSK